MCNYIRRYTTKVCTVNLPILHSFMDNFLSCKLFVASKHRGTSLDVVHLPLARILINLYECSAAGAALMHANHVLHVFCLRTFLPLRKPLISEHFISSFCRKPNRRGWELPDGTVMVGSLPASLAGDACWEVASGSVTGQPACFSLYQLWTAAWFGTVPDACANYRPCFRCIILCPKMTFEAIFYQ